MLEPPYVVMDPGVVYEPEASNLPFVAPDPGVVKQPVVCLLSTFAAAVELPCLDLCWPRTLL